MSTCRYAEMPVANPAPDTFRRQAHSKRLMMVIVDFVNGPSRAVPAHQHPHEQISYIAEGRVRFIVGEGAEQRVDEVEPGDMVVIPPNAPHTVELLTESARVVDCFHPIREDFL